MAVKPLASEVCLRCGLVVIAMLWHAIPSLLIMVLCVVYCSLKQNNSLTAVRLHKNNSMMESSKGMLWCIM